MTTGLVCFPSDRSDGDNFLETELSSIVEGSLLPIQRNWRMRPGKNGPRYWAAPPDYVSERQR